jgi:hypothetical protein
MAKIDFYNCPKCKKEVHGLVNSVCPKCKELGVEKLDNSFINKFKSLFGFSRRQRLKRIDYYIEILNKFIFILTSKRNCLQDKSTQNSKKEIFYA